MKYHCIIPGILSGSGEFGCEPHAVFRIAVIGTVERADCCNEGDVRQCATGAQTFLECVQPKVQPDGGQGWPSELDAQACVADAAHSNPVGATLAGSLEIKEGKHLGVAVVILNERYGLSPNNSVLIESDSNTNFSCDVDADETPNYFCPIGCGALAPLLTNIKQMSSTISVSSDTANVRSADHVRQPLCQGLFSKQRTTAASQLPATDYQEACR